MIMFDALKQMIFESENICGFESQTYADEIFADVRSRLATSGIHLSDSQIHALIDPEKLRDLIATKQLLHRVRVYNVKESNLTKSA